jgi:hypothetical protein
MRCKYTRYQVEPSLTIPDGYVYRPEVLLRVIGTTGQKYVTALVDSGADESVFPISIADVVGAELYTDASSDAAGIAGQSLVLFPAEVELELMHSNESFRWKTLASFATLESADNDTAVLGHANCLEFFKGDCLPPSCGC